MGFGRFGTGFVCVCEEGVQHVGGGDRVVFARQKKCGKMCVDERWLFQEYTIYEQIKKNGILLLLLLWNFYLLMYTLFI